MLWVNHHFRYAPVLLVKRRCRRRIFRQRAEEGYGFAQQPLRPPDKSTAKPGHITEYEARLASPGIFQRFVVLQNMGFPAKARLKDHHHFHRCHHQCERVRELL